MDAAFSKSAGVGVAFGMVMCPECCVGVLAAGRGAVYTYDAIGSYERTGYSCQGSGKDLMQPVLDNQLKAASPLLVPARVRAAGGCRCC